MRCPQTVEAQLDVADAAASGIGARIKNGRRRGQCRSGDGANPQGRAWVGTLRPAFDEKGVLAFSEMKGRDCNGVVLRHAALWEVRVRRHTIKPHIDQKRDSTSARTSNTPRGSGARSKDGGGRHTVPE